MSHFKTLMLVFLSVTAHASFGTDRCPKINKVAAILCEGEATALLSASKNYQQRTAKAEAMAVIAESGYASCASARAACVEICPKEAQQAERLRKFEEANHLEDLVVDCATGETGQNFDMVQNAAIAARSLANAAKDEEDCAEGRRDCAAKDDEGVPVYKTYTGVERPPSAPSIGSGWTSLFSN